MVGSSDVGLGLARPRKEDGDRGTRKSGNVRARATGQARTLELIAGGRGGFIEREREGFFMVHGGLRRVLGLRADGRDLLNVSGFQGVSWVPRASELGRIGSS